MHGERSEIGSGKAAVGRHVVGGEGARPRQVAPWPERPWLEPKAWTPWTWDETADQFVSKRKIKSRW